MAKELHPGHYVGKIINYGLREGKQFTVTAVIEMEFKDTEGDLHRCNWYGSFSGDAKKHTFKALLVCGLQKGVTDLALGPAGGCLNTEKEYSIEVKAEAYQGKTYYKIAWINPLGLTGLLSRADAMVRLQGLNLDGEIAMMRAQMGAAAPKQEQRPQAPQEPENRPSFEEIPF
jgi:hypothetical protein